MNGNPAGHEANPPSAALSIGIEGAAWLAGAQDAWTELLANSSADRLFMSWTWQERWWANFGQPLAGQPTIITVKDASGRLVGIAPFFRRVTPTRQLRLTAVQLAPIGNVWRMNVGEVTEHIDWIIRHGSEAAAATAIAAHLAKASDWDELLFSYTDPHSIAATALTSMSDENGWYVRREEPLQYYSIDTAQSFGRYIDALGANTRLRVHGRRKLLQTLGTVTLISATREELGAQFDKLEELSSRRWNARLAPNVRNFLTDIAFTWLQQDRLGFSTLEVNGRPISASFDIQVDDAVYNIRSAIDTSFHRRISPGSLHLGYAVENACRHHSVTQYHLLAGRGKHTDYKRNVASAKGALVSFQIIRNRHQRYMYQLYDRIRRFTASS